MLADPTLLTSFSALPSNSPRCSPKQRSEQPSSHRTESTIWHCRGACLGLLRALAERQLAPAIIIHISFYCETHARVSGTQPSGAKHGDKVEQDVVRKSVGNGWCKEAKSGPMVAER